MESTRRYKPSKQNSDIDRARLQCEHRRRIDPESAGLFRVLSCVIIAAVQANRIVYLISIISNRESVLRWRKHARRSRGRCARLLTIQHVTFLSENVPFSFRHRHSLLTDYGSCTFTRRVNKQLNTLSGLRCTLVTIGHTTRL